jgi:hypothetical protein
MPSVLEVVGAGGDASVVHPLKAVMATMIPTTAAAEVTVARVPVRMVPPIGLTLVVIGIDEVL